MSHDKCIKAAPRVLSSNDTANLSEDAESLREVYVTPYANLSSTKLGRYAEFIRDDSYLNWKDAFWSVWVPLKQSCACLIKTQNGQYFMSSRLNHDR